MSEYECPPHDWETGSDGWGVVFGVSRCKKCGALVESALIDLGRTEYASVNRAALERVAAHLSTEEPSDSESEQGE